VFATDKLESKYPMLSSYSAFANSLIYIVDKDGNENIIYIVNVPDENGILSISDEELQNTIDEINNLLQKRAEEEGYEAETRLVLFSEREGQDKMFFHDNTLDRKFLDDNDGIVLVGESDDLRLFD